MDTIIALHDSEDLATHVLHPDLTGSGDDALRIPPGRLVIVMLQTARRLRVFAFRTLAGPSPTAALVPAIRPGVDLLLATRSRLAASRIRNMLLHFRKRAIDPDRLSDDFWLHLGILLNGRLRGRAFLADLLAHETLD